MAAELQSSSFSRGERRLHRLRPEGNPGSRRKPETKPDTFRKRIDHGNGQLKFPPRRNWRTGNRKQRLTALQLFRTAHPVDHRLCGDLHQKSASVQRQGFFVAHAVDPFHGGVCRKIDGNWTGKLPRFAPDGKQKSPFPFEEIAVTTLRKPRQLPQITGPAKEPGQRVVDRSDRFCTEIKSDRSIRMFRIARIKSVIAQIVPVVTDRAAAPAENHLFK